MKHKHTNRVLSVLLAVCMLLGAAPAAFWAANAAGGAESHLGRFIVDDVDEDGNMIAPYRIDEDGNIIEPKPAESVTAADSLPGKYDIRSYDYVTPIKNQAKAEDCWAFSTISCIESSLIKQGYGAASNTDYSEAHLTWFTMRQRNSDASDPASGDGRWESNPFSIASNYYYSSATLMRGCGPQLESNAPWTEPSSTSAAYSSMQQPESSRYDSYARLYTSEHIQNDSISDAKAALMRNGNLGLVYYHDPSAVNTTYYCHYQNNETVKTNHLVAVVGWDDSFSRTKFNASMRPSANGAWLVKGSWGVDHPETNNGYYWISYYDTSVCQLFSFVAKPKDIYDNIYQYDGGISQGTLTSGSSACTANRFLSTKNESLTHIAFYSPNDEKTNVKAEIYVAPSGYTPPSGNDPTNGMTKVSAATTTLSNVTTGYYTVELPQAVDVSNKYYTVMLTWTNSSGGTVYASLEGTSDETNSYSAKKGQSFCVFNGAWCDCTNISGGNYHNAPIKAMTKDTAPASFTLTYDANGGYGAPAPQTGSTNYTIPSTTPTRSGYTFLGWATSPTATEARFSPGTPVVLSEDVTLYAVWKKNETTATLTVSPKNITVKVNEEFTVTCTKSGVPSGESVYIDLYVQKDGGSYGYVDSYTDWSGNSMKIGLYSDGAMTGTLRFDLVRTSDDTVLASDTARVTVKEVPVNAKLTVSPKNVTAKVNENFTFTCTKSGVPSGTDVRVDLYVLENDGSYTYFDSYDDWNGNSMKIGLVANNTLTTTLRFDLVQTGDDTVLASDTAQLTVKDSSSWIETLWDIISFPFRIILYPFIFLWDLIFG